MVRLPKLLDLIERHFQGLGQLEEQRFDLGVEPLSGLGFVGESGSRLGRIDRKLGLEPLELGTAARGGDSG